MWTLASCLALALAAFPPTRRDAARLELVETAPVETSLDAPDLRATHEVWIECIEGASESIDVAQFYAADAPARADGTPRRTRLTAVVEALERAAGRGVRIRFLLSERFRDTYPELPARLAALDQVEVRWLDLEPVTGGVMHAKYWIFDAEDVFVGSQNFDWRSLEHIQELGLLVRGEPAVSLPIGDVFRLDWARAGGSAPPPLGEGGSATHGVWPLISPRDLPPVTNTAHQTEHWDLPQIVDLIEAATSTVRVQLLSYSPTDGEGSYFAELDTALRAAAARGVDVRLLVADWGKRPGRVEWLQSLQAVPNLSVRFVTIPQAAEGFIPFARCVHAKYLVVDGGAAWLGSSNWSRSYFYESRNVGLRLVGGAVPRRLQRFHTETWDSPYAYDVDPAATYVPPRVSD